MKNRNVCPAADRLKDLILQYFPTLKAFGNFIDTHPTYLTRLVRAEDASLLTKARLKKFEQVIGFNSEYIINGTGEPIIDADVFNLALQKFRQYAKENKIYIEEKASAPAENGYDNAVLLEILDNLSIAYSKEDSLSELLRNKDIIKITTYSSTLEQSGIPKGSIVLLNTKYKDNDKVIFIYSNKAYYGTLNSNDLFVEELNIKAPLVSVKIMGKVCAKIVFE